jgi:hypothetical protein
MMRAHAGLESHRGAVQGAYPIVLLPRLLVVYSLSSVITSIYPSPTFYITPGYVLTGMHRAGLPRSLLNT